MNGSGSRTVGLLVVGMTLAALLCLSPATADDAKETPAERLARIFKNRDRNKDRRLSLKEFLANRVKMIDVATRDFRLFDQDSDGWLSQSEFSTVPTIVRAEDRGELPDPIRLLVDQAIVAMDKSFDDWDTKPDVEIDVNQFINAFVSTLGSGTAKPNPREADQDGDRRVSRGEAQRFLEIQLGLRRSDGKLLREPGGRVCNLMLFQHIDLNQNDRLEREEFVQRSFGKINAEELFDQANTDGNNSLSFDEWCRLPGRGFVDPVNEFRRMDTNLDARVDPKELAAAMPEWKKKMASSVFPGFDLDRDGKLTLAEYRLTMPANPVLPWQQVIRDTDGDEQLSFAEFKFRTLQFPLLRFIYFHRLDVNGNQALDPDEFSFKIRVPDEFFVLKQDGTGWRSLFKFEGYPACGSPAVSPDGKQIAFDAWSIKPRTSSALFVMSIDGTNPRKLCSGMMPTWSKDGKMLSCSTGGVRIIDADGNLHKLIRPGGWGAQWSPDGKQIAFTEGGAIKTYDVETEAIHTVLDNGAHEYRSIYWNMTWSPDSKQLCFKGVKADGTAEVTSVNTTGDAPKLKVHYSAAANLKVKVNVNADFSWHPNGDRIVFSMTCPPRRCMQLYEFDPNKDDPPQLVVGQDETRNNTDACWTPDGKWLIVTSGDF